MIPLRPSAAKFWTNCAAYPKMVAALPPQPDSDPAREGTCAAWVAERLVRSEPVAVGDRHENGWEVDDDMMRHMRRYVEILRGFGGSFDVERFVRLNEMIAGTTDAWGMIVRRDDGSLWLIVVDLKYGYGVVEPAYNPQCSCYGGALVRQYQQHGYDIAGVTIVIHQPRATHPDGPTRSWNVGIREFMGHVAEIERKGRECQADDPIARAGAHCNDCPAATPCFALGRSLYQAYGTMRLSQARQMNREELAAELVFLGDIEKMVKARKNMVEAEAKAHIERGTVVPGWCLGSGQGQRRFKVGSDAVQALTGIDPRSDKMATPAEMIRRGADERTINALTETPRTAAKLVRMTAEKAGSMFK